jgi:peptidoglycan/LPS O-acetylase OafA/YrhL
MTIPTNSTAISAARHGRRYDIDVLRVLAFSVLILYHVGMFYALDRGWHVKSAYQFDWLNVPMNFFSQWRMALLFVISGLAVSFVWGKYSAAKFAGRRTWRLLLPLVFGMAFIVAPQAYYEALSNGIIEPGFFAFMGQYLTFQDFPGEAWGGENIITWTWNHLWYLAYVLFYTLLLIPLAKFLDGSGKAIRTGFQNLRGVWLVVIPVIPLMIYGNFVFPRFPYINHAFLDDWYAHALYFTLFFYGFLMGRDAGIWQELARIRKLTLAAAVLFYGLLVALNAFVGDNPPFLVEQSSFAVIYLNRWLWIVTAFGWGHHLLNKPMKWLPYATQAVYPWYILHQTIIVVVGFNLSKLALGPIVEPALLLALTIGGCYAIYEFLIRRVAVLRPLFGVGAIIAPPKKESAAEAALVVQ